MPAGKKAAIARGLLRYSQRADVFARSHRRVACYNVKI